MLPMLRFRPLHFLITTALVLLSGSVSGSGLLQDSQTELVPSFPTGALASFPQAVDPRNGKVDANKIFIRPDAGDDFRVWVVASQEVWLPNAAGSDDENKSLPTEKGIGFVVPQLAKGRYVAWYESTSRNQPGQSMKLMIVPELFADDGIKRSVPGKDVEVLVRIYSPTVSRKGSSTPERLTVSITLKSENPSVADIVQERNRTVSTNAEGYVLWKVHIKTAGVAALTATAENFEPVSVEVVGMPASARTFREAQVIVAEGQASERETVARAATEKLNGLEKAAADWEEQTQNQTAAANTANRQSAAEVQARINAINRRSTELRQNVEKAREIVLETVKEALDARTAVQDLVEQVATLQPISIVEADLKPGDILLVQGSTPLISSLIRNFESRQLGGQTPYSHASLYLGNIDGTGLVAEMWPKGYWITPLSESTRGALIVDVYRWKQIDDAKAQQIADRAGNLFGPRSSFTTRSAPVTGSLLPYAFEEIGLLVTAAEDIIPSSGLRWTATKLVDPFAGGRRKMICSEFVAWVYHDVGLELEVTPWKRLADANLLTTEDRRKDYTTPNMIARSGNLQKVGRYLGP